MDASNRQAGQQDERRQKSQPAQDEPQHRRSHGHALLDEHGWER
jgi:hypothetical protein